MEVMVSVIMQRETRSGKEAPANRKEIIGKQASGPGATSPSQTENKNRRTNIVQRFLFVFRQEIFQTGGPPCQTYASRSSPGPIIGMSTAVASTREKQTILLPVSSL